MNAILHDSFLHLVRLGISHDDNTEIPDKVDWVSLKALADRHGLSAVVLDGINKLKMDDGIRTDGLSPQQRLEWIGELLQNYEARYSAYEKAIGSLAGWYNQHGFKMMVLKGYGCSLNWPIPEHRPCGDIDIWLFDRFKDADSCIAFDKGLRIDNSHLHHTVFEWEGFMVENHYDFLNVHHHKSNIEMEHILKDLGKDDSMYIDVCGERVYLPSANLHALFLLRHSMSNFASTGFQLRQLLDWAFFVEKHRKEIDWGWLDEQVDYFGMKKLYDVFNAICVGDLGFDVKLFPPVQFAPSLKDRVLNDILEPEFSEKESGGFFSRAVLKYRRWRANAWKHRLCFKESMWNAFWSGVKGHLMKPSSI